MERINLSFLEKSYETKSILINIKIINILQIEHLKKLIRFLTQLSVSNYMTE